MFRGGPHSVQVDSKSGPFKLGIGLAVTTVTACSPGDSDEAEGPGDSDEVSAGARDGGGEAGSRDSDKMGADGGLGIARVEGKEMERAEL